MLTDNNNESLKGQTVSNDERSCLMFLVLAAKSNLVYSARKIVHRLVLFLIVTLFCYFYKGFAVIKLIYLVNLLFFTMESTNSLLLTS